MLYRKLGVALIAASVVVSCAGESLAQGRYIEVAARYNRAQVYHQALVLPDGADRAAVVTFRIPNSLLVFTNETNGFEANVDLTVELYEGTRKVDEQIWRSRHSASTFEDTRSRTHDLQGRIHFDVEPGEYTYRLIMNDDGGDDRAAARTFRVPEDGTPLYGSLVFAASKIDSAGVRLEDANLAGDLPFGADLPAILPVAIGSESSPDATVLTYQLYQLSANRKEKPDPGSSLARSGSSPPAPEIPDDIEKQPGDHLVSTGKVLAGDLIAVGGILREDADCLCWEPDGAPGRGATLAAIPLKSHELENGRYLLEVTHTASGKAEQFVFETQWRNMPISLYDIDVAIRNLEFIEDRATIRGMRRGSRDEKVEAFQAYWSERDPTPNTVRNELMEEYYRRVDEAAVKFRTGQHPVPDGLRTDPARIYVLYGEPDQITNTLPSSGGVEQTWRYADGREFVFWAGSSLAPMELVE